ncbi:hypothetical protein [Arenimonas sp. MALMAid1274]|uniref:hypothetical protein n=1 Tax=Arenimonas sp. MALMAid1274 TaxID=3411630 RepID=UPI003BA337AA
MMKNLVVAFATLLAIAGGAVLSAAGAQGTRADVTYHALPPPPAIEIAAEAPVAAPAARPRAPLVSMAPPPPRACITKTELDNAMMGSGCSCTCDEYANKPVAPVCDVACMGHYACWAPQVTDAELQESLAEMGMATAALSRDERETLRGVVRATKGSEWSSARMCEK